ncbi:hypothetical protein [Albidovulum sp.]
MKKRFLRHHLLLVLVVVLTGWTGIAAAKARGQLRAGGEAIVLCSGGGLVQIALDPDGRARGVRICPDLAAALVAAPVLAPPSVPAATGRATRLVPPAAVTRRGAVPAVARARDPPRSV